MALCTQVWDPKLPGSFGHDELGKLVDMVIPLWHIAVLCATGADGVEKVDM